MDRYTNIVRESPVVQHVDGEVHRRNQRPFADRHVWRSEVVFAVNGKLAVVCRKRSEDPLEEGD